MSRIITAPINAYLSPYNRVTPEALRSGDIARDLFFTSVEMSSPGYTLVGRGEVQVELISPDDFVAGEVTALREQAAKLRAEAQQKIDAIEDRIRNLQALTYEAA